MDNSGFTFTAPLWHWRGPAPHYFLRVPADMVADLKELSKLVTYGWGMIPVTVTLGQADLGQWEYDTSLFPKDGGYLVPVRSDARKAAAYQEGDEVGCVLMVRSGKARRSIIQTTLKNLEAGE